MERLLSASQPFLPNHSETRGKDEMNHDEKLQSKEEATDQATTDQEMMTREGLDRRNVWEPSVYYALGKESFYFVGHEINIRESMDSYGALIWPGVSPSITIKQIHWTIVVVLA
ncbi:hypothetical protein ILYODFUR_009283 [Ilyodon furcidens]|uniref:Uncharacterized protein n=1 Tax=Ilyodon furcidens TaxID=33524 RepID=A0ABV0SJS2_9TELE